MFSRFFSRVRVDKWRPRDYVKHAVIPWFPGELILQRKGHAHDTDARFVRSRRVYALINMPRIWPRSYTSLWLIVSYPHTRARDVACNVVSVISGRTDPYHPSSMRSIMSSMSMVYICTGIVSYWSRWVRHILGWRLACSEHAGAWQALLARIAPPDVVVTDGGAGFAKACHAQWSDTKIQRCLFHISANVRSRTTRNPRHKAGQELYALSQQLTRITNDEQQAAWIGCYTTWCATYKHMLAEKPCWLMGVSSTLTSVS